VRLLAAIPIALLLCGCTYTVRVRNDNDQAITASLIQTDPLMKDWTLDSKRVEPNEVVQLGPAQTSAATVVFEADPTLGDGMEKVSRTIIPGDHAFRVGKEDDGAKSRVTVRSSRWRDLTPDH
jgi:hypothetical protein